MSLVAACNDTECRPCGDGTAYLLDGYAFATSVETNGDQILLDGFDLDGIDAKPGDPAGCRFGDATAPDGRTGIDNQLGYLTALFDYESLRVVPGAFAETVSNGTGLIVIEATSGTPDAPGGGKLYAWSLSDPALATGLPLTDASISLGGADLAAIADTNSLSPGGHVIWGPYEATFRFRVGDIWTGLTFERAHLRLEPSADGTRLNGYFGGLVSLPVAHRFLVDIQPNNPNISSALDTLLPLLADTRSAPDADCDRISVGFGVTYRRVHLTD
ncbi:MAG: hypothetical protein D6761_05125 [Candidatus Dadabacteria bacterium]|nr:MAG: hypothetical protein D6761_05125 [Candidatus Dadabacteria bacterium]